jgi:hypothetical protein
MFGKKFASVSSIQKSDKMIHDQGIQRSAKSVRPLMPDVN